MKSWFKKGQKGFTLVELMVVMGILGVLAAIVVPAVSGTTEVSTDAQVKTDAGMVQSAIGEYYGDQVGAEVFTTSTKTILGTTLIAQKISTRWPENYLQTGYAAEFPETTNSVASVLVTLTSGTAPTEMNEALAEGYNAIDFKKLYNTTAETNYPVAAYIPTVPASATDTHNDLTTGYHNYLWLVKVTKASSGSGGDVESRTVVVLKLAKIATAEGNGKDTLTYEKIY